MSAWLSQELPGTHVFTQTQDQILERIGHAIERLLRQRCFPRRCRRLRLGEQVLNYAAVQQISYDVAAALQRTGITPGDKVAVLSANDPIAFASIFGISRAGAVWCPINPRNAAAENRDLLELFDCKVLIYQQKYKSLLAEIRAELPQLRTLVCLDNHTQLAPSFAGWLSDVGNPQELPTQPADEVIRLFGLRVGSVRLAG